MNIDYGLKSLKTGYINWGPYVMKSQMEDSIVKKLLKEGKKAKTSYNTHLAGHLNYQFLYPKVIQQWFYQALNPYVQAYRKGHCRFHGIEEHNLELEADDLWVNFMKPGDFNPVHTHGGDYSFVLFLDVPKKLEKEQREFKGTSVPPGSIMFEYGVQAKPKWATTGNMFIPQTGDFLMYPALLEHWVCPFKSKITRVSVSGNMRITNRDQLPKGYF